MKQRNLPFVQTILQVAKMHFLETQMLQINNFQKHLKGGTILRKRPALMQFLKGANIEKLKKLEEGGGELAFGI